MGLSVEEVVAEEARAARAWRQEQAREWEEHMRAAAPVPCAWKLGCAGTVVWVQDGAGLWFQTRYCGDHLCLVVGTTSGRRCRMSRLDGSQVCGTHARMARSA